MYGRHERVLGSTWHVLHECGCFGIVGQPNRGAIMKPGSCLKCWHVCVDGIAIMHAGGGMLWCHFLPPLGLRLSAVLRAQAEGAPTTDPTLQIFFETFNVPEMYIGMQAVLALYAAFAAAEKRHQVLAVNTYIHATWVSLPHFPILHGLLPP